MVLRSQQRAGREAVQVHGEVVLQLLQREASQVDRLLHRLVDDADEPLANVHSHDLQAGARPAAAGVAGQGPSRGETGSRPAPALPRRPHLQRCGSCQWSVLCTGPSQSGREEWPVWQWTPPVRPAGLQGSRGGRPRGAEESLLVLGGVRARARRPADPRTPTERPKEPPAASRSHREGEAVGGPHLGHWTEVTRAPQGGRERAGRPAPANLQSP